MPDVAHEAARLVDEGDLRENFLRLFTRNFALVRNVTSTGTTLTPVFHAVDGRKSKPANRWEAGPCPAYMTVDLGSQTSFNKVLIYFKKSSVIAYQYKISYSKDNKNFIELINRSENKVIQEIHPLTHRFPTVKGRYVRLTVLGNTDNEKAFVREFEIYEEVKNLAVGQYCTQEDENLINLTNGTSFIGAYSELKRNIPVFIDLGEVCEMNTTKVSFKRREELTYKVFVSIDGNNYTEVGDMWFDDQNWLAFKSLKARYIKVTFPKDQLVYVNEIRVRKTNQYPDPNE